MSVLQTIKSKLSQGHVYRRSDIERYSNAVDRHLKQLQRDKTLIKLSGGMYYYPKQTVFGFTPARDCDLVKSFLKDARFLITTPNAYNALGVGTTQLYNETTVYNHKRHGMFKLGAREFRFIVKHHFPLSLSNEFLLIDLVDNVDRLSEDREKILTLIKEKVKSMDFEKLQSMVLLYGSSRSKKFFSTLLQYDN